jgi:aspartyl-tRNA(Asn)/glutamyl-tRNA(Gln) amidotransferase subunit C
VDSKAEKGKHEVTISREDVLRVAELAHLELDEKDVETYRSQLDEILAYIGKLNELDTSAVEPMAQTFEAGRGEGEAAGMVSGLRDDVVHKADVAEAVLKNAPEVRWPYFVVPKVIER